MSSIAKTAQNAPGATQAVPTSGEAPLAGTVVSARPQPCFHPCPTCGLLTLRGPQGEVLTGALGYDHLCGEE
jgi:hypothetical protein